MNKLSLFSIPQSYSVFPISFKGTVKNLFFIVKYLTSIGYSNIGYQLLYFTASLLFPHSDKYLATLAFSSGNICKFILMPFSQPVNEASSFFLVIITVTSPWSNFSYVSIFSRLIACIVRLQFLRKNFFHQSRCRTTTPPCFFQTDSEYLAMAHAIVVTIPLYAAYILLPLQNPW